MISSLKMLSFKMLVAKQFYFVFIISVSAEIGPEKDTCGILSTEEMSNADILSTVDKWWNEQMSIKKPLKCKETFVEKNIPEDILSVFDPRFPILSYPCSKLTDENSIKFHFHGEIVDGLLTGPGKLTLSGPGLTASKEACLKVVTVLVRKNFYFILVNKTGIRPVS